MVEGWMERRSRAAGASVEESSRDPKDERGRLKNRWRGSWAHSRDGRRFVGSGRDWTRATARTVEAGGVRLLGPRTAPLLGRGALDWTRRERGLHSLDSRLEARARIGTKRHLEEPH